TPYAPEGSFERRYSGWPVPGVQALRYYFEPDGSLNEAKPSTTADAGSSFNHNPALARTGNMVGDNPGNFDTKWTWTTPPTGDAIAFQTAPLSKDMVLLGHSSADLYVRSTSEDADLQVNVTEVRSDGQELYVQSGMQRASQRA